MGQHRVAWGSTGWHGGSTGWHWVAQGGMEWHMAEMVGIGRHGETQGGTGWHWAAIGSRGQRASTEQLYFGPSGLRALSRN